MRERMSYIVEIGNCLVSSEIITEYFACDYQACHGCCCIIGDSGAPMEDGEEKLFVQEYGGYEHLLTPEGKEALKQQGFAHALNGMFEGLTSPGATLTVALYVYAKEEGEFGVAFGIAAILMILTLLINLSATMVGKYFSKRRSI